MYFNEVLGLKKCEESKKLRRKETIRALILNDDKILMMSNKRGDYNFPGGGTKDLESHVDTLKREVREETGYIVKEVGERLGTVIERNYDRFEEDTIFELISSYYICELSDQRVEKELEDYEIDLNLEEVWISMDDALSNNTKILNDSKGYLNPWVRRETKALEILNEIIKFDK